MPEIPEALEDAALFAARQAQQQASPLQQAPWLSRLVGSVVQTTLELAMQHYDRPVRPPGGEIPAPGPRTILTGRGFIASVNRVAEYLRQRKRMKDLGETIHSCHSDPDADVVELTIEDVEAVLRRALPIRYPDRDDLAFELFAADNSKASREHCRDEFERLKREQAAAGETFYIYPLADAAIEQFRKTNS
jgi:hypothetical protein